MEKLTKVSKAVYWTLAAVASVISLVFMVRIFGGTRKVIEEVADCPIETTDED